MRLDDQTQGTFTVDIELMLSVSVVRHGKNTKCSSDPEFCHFKCFSKRVESGNYGIFYFAQIKNV